MKALASFLEGRWSEGSGDPTTLTDPTTGAAVAQVRKVDVPLGRAMAWARSRGGVLRALTFAQRAEILAGLSAVIHAHRDELIEVSRWSGGTTRGDGKFDIDGAAGTLAWYAAFGKTLGDRTFLLDGPADPVLRSKRFVGQHVLMPRPGLAVHINAFNFPAWGMAEKAAVALLAGVPVFTKPATSTSALAVRIVELWVGTGLLPEGALSLLTGPAGDLLDHVGPQDVVAFTGGSETGFKIRSHPAIVRHNVRVNIEADSLNASILGPDVDPASDTFQMFVNDVTRDLVQKAGQKCTCVRRILVPTQTADTAIQAIVDRLSRVVVGDPNEKGTEIGPVASPAQQQVVQAGLQALGEVAKIVWRADAPDGGCFVTPTLFVNEQGAAAPYVHEHEVFGPVATVLPWSGDADGAVEIVAKGGGGLVCSLYSDDLAFVGPVLAGIAPWHGRIHWGSAKVHDQSPGPGTVLPNLLHGGPGKAGGGEELGGGRGLAFYCQRTAIMGDRALLERLYGTAG
jgi:3,4-dehydroadipyl-CoA semialdehyde dehydrogenase